MFQTCPNLLFVGLLSFGLCKYFLLGLGMFIKSKKHRYSMIQYLFIPCSVPHFVMLSQPDLLPKQRRKRHQEDQVDQRTLESGSTAVK